MISEATPPPLILASSSRYRGMLLQRLGLSFRSVAPEVDESLLPDETVAAACRRLAALKATTVAARHPQDCVLASDQLAEQDGQALGKPGSLSAARAQLARLSGTTVQFHTAICLRHGDQEWEHLDCTRVQFRALDAATIDRYLDAEPALDCAGSFKAEGLGISLFESIDNADPTALIGLPLIATACLLRAAGYRIP